MARILVTGVTGQVGGYVAAALLAAGHETWGTRGPRGAELPEGVHDAGVLDASVLHAGAFDGPGHDASLPPADFAAALLARAAGGGRLDAVVHLAGQPRVGASFQTPLAVWDSTATLCAHLAEAAARARVRFVHASSAELFAGTSAPVQNEETPLCPRSPYGAAKAAAHLYVQALREGRGAHASNAIFYLGESERRSADYVFGKITRGLAEVSLGRAQTLSLGNLQAVRDFLHARDLAAAVVLLATGPTAPAGDYVVASGEGHAIAEVAALACEYLGLRPDRVLRQEASLLRPADAPSLIGDARRLRALGWAPGMDFRTLVHTVTEFHLRALRAAGDDAGAPSATGTGA